MLVNCFAGMSRSASCVTSYLILHKGMDANEALKMIKLKRDVWPSNENLAHLARMSNEIHGFKIDDLGENEFEMESYRRISKPKKT